MNTLSVLQDVRIVKKCQELSTYLIRKGLLEKQSYYNGLLCAHCHKKKEPGELRAIRGSKNGDSHQVSNYTLVCERCRKKRVEEKEAKHRAERLYTAKRSGKRDHSSKAYFYNSIRAEVLERDGHRCCYCGKETNSLAPIRPLCKGGELSIDNYTAACSSCRPSKGDMLPLDFIIKRLNDEYCWEEVFEDEDLGMIKVGIGMVTVDPYYLAEAMQFLSKLVSNKDIEREIRNKAERLVVKLGETEEDRRREAKQELRPLF